MAGLGTNVGTEFDLSAIMDGVVVFEGVIYRTWFFDEGASGHGFLGNRDTPSAHVEVIEGEHIRLHFHNSSVMDHTIHLHGLDVDQLNDGVPQTSFAIPPESSHTYEFTAPHAGTYHYHCHVDTVIHYHRGMAGTIIVRPPDASTSQAWTGGPEFDEEALWHLHTFDLAWGDLNASGLDTARHRPDMFLINGKPTGEAATDPPSTLTLTRGGTAYLRLLNMGYQWARVRLGDLPFEVVATDGRPMPRPPVTDVWEIGPGERYDLLVPGSVAGTFEATVDYLDDYSGAVLGRASTIVVIE